MAKLGKMEKCMLCALISGLLFFALTPGVLLTLPPEKSCGVFLQLKDKDGGCATGWAAAAVHAVVFAVLVFLVSLVTYPM